MKAAYVTIYDARDVRAWSGLGYHIARCLEHGDISLEHLGPLQRRRHPLALVRQLEARLQRRSYPLDRDPHVARAYAARVERLLRSTTYDLVFSPGTIPVAYLETNRPLAFWTDATFAAMLRSYAEYRSFSTSAIRAGYALDQRALARADVAFYASEWAAKSAIEDHGADPAKVEVVPFGANMPIEHERHEVEQMVARRPPDRCRLLFLGVDWVRKGGDRAVEVARLLNERGLVTELHVAGSEPESATNLPSWVHVHGFIDKSVDGGRAHLRRLLERSHFLIHPAVAEAFGVVFCEAAAHGVVSVASRVGGIPSAVREGVTGTLCDPLAPAHEYAERIFELMEDRCRYEAMAVGAFDEYQRSLSWESHAARLRARLDHIA